MVVVVVVWSFELLSSSRRVTTFGGEAWEEVVC